MKVIVLNSGGFDSVVLMHYVKEMGHDIVSLFFEYGQKNLAQEARCAIKVADKLGAEREIIHLPKFIWSDSNIVSDQSDNQYLEWRNLIFLSYATSIAESLGIKEIYMALIDNNVEVIYKDCSPEFVNKFNDMDLGVTLITPFISNTKEELGGLAKKYGIIKSDFFSCNLPDEFGKECGVCTDCEGIKEIYDFYFKNHTAEEVWVDNDYGISPEFETMYKAGKLKTLKVFINNNCQFNCGHCLMNGVELNSEPMDGADIINILDEAISMGVEQIDFMGKEPLFDCSIFAYLAFLWSKEHKPEIGIVTNGVNVERYIDLLEITKPKIILSYEPSGEYHTRTYHGHIFDTIMLLLEKNIPVELTLDVHNGNYDKVISAIYFYNDLGVKDFYIKTFMPCGKNQKEIEKMVLNEEQFLSMYKSLKRVNREGLKITLAMTMKETYTFGFIPEVDEDLYYCDLYKNAWVTKNLYISPERFCDCSDFLTITSDGYALKCGMFLSLKDYHKHAVGNIKDTGLLQLFELSKQKSVDEVFVCPFSQANIKKIMERN